MKWISVKDRLPKHGQIVDIWACYNKREKEIEEIYIRLNKKGWSCVIGNPEKLNGWRVTNTKCYHCEDEDGKFISFEKGNKSWVIDEGNVTHWLPLPDPPENNEK